MSVSAAHFSLALLRNTLFEDTMVNNCNDRWRLECHRAFQIDPSWYEAYWYRVPTPQRQSFLIGGTCRMSDLR